MSKRSGVSIRLLGPFRAETADGRVLSIRSRKARALIAYLAMKPDYWASREELATLLWGDRLDVMARQSLRQCLTSLRRDLRLAPNLLPVEGERILLAVDPLAVDAREIITLARSSEAESICRAADLCRGEFLADLRLEAEEFESWRLREAERLRATAAHVLARRVRLDDECGAGESAVEMAERLVELDPTREDWQRVALIMWARYRGREAALERAKLLTDLLRQELAVAPEKETSALIKAIEAGEIGSVPRSPPTVPGRAAGGNVEGPVVTGQAAAATPLVVPEPSPPTARWNIRTAAAAGLTLLVVSAFGLSTWSRHPDIHRVAKNAAIPVAVLPFTLDGSDAAGKILAEALTHDLTGYLAHYPELRVMSDKSLETYRAGIADVWKVRSELGAPYAIVGRVQTADDNLQITFQLVDTASHLVSWSHQVRREPGDPGLAADEVARGVARAIAMQVTSAEARRDDGVAGPQEPIEGLVVRARAAEQLGPWSGNLSEAWQLFQQALARDPHYLPAMLGVARVSVMANANMIALDPPVDIARAKDLLQEILSRSPDNYSAFYNLGMAQSEEGQFETGIQSLERALQINPSTIMAHALIGHQLTNLGRPREALERIRQSIRLGANEPSLGYAYLYAAEAELAMGDPRAARDWALRAAAFFPNAPRFEAWIAALDAITGDNTDAAIHADQFRRASPQFANGILESQESAQNKKTLLPPAILQGLRVALAAIRG
jgi:DNA-binding SARP family transcriptional activator/TolB-like protein/cytochrome c-type biogenesis protein CcmH/NrfG